MEYILDLATIHDLKTEKIEAKNMFQALILSKKIAEEFAKKRDIKVYYSVRGEGNLYVIEDPLHSDKLNNLKESC